MLICVNASMENPPIPVQAASPVLPDTLGRPLNNRLGLIYMTAGMFIYSAVDTLAKFLTESLSPMQVVWSRQFGMVAVVIVLLLLRGRSVLQTDHPKLQIVRGALAACSASLFIFGISFVPLADAVAVSFIAPFFVTVMGAWWLKEPVGVRRWLAVIVGFIGMLVVVRPGAGVMDPAVLFIVAAAFFFALRQIISRQLGATDKTETTIAYTALVSAALLTLPMPFYWQMPQSWFEIGLLTALAILAVGGEFFVIKALETAHAVVVAPMQYTLIVWGTFYGYLVFDHLPDGWTWVGAAIIVASGLYTLRREQKAKV